MWTSSSRGWILLPRSPSNGTQIVQSDNMFIEHRVPVASLLSRPELGPRSPASTAENTLEITFESARRRGLELVDEHREHRFIVHQTEVSRGPVRKAQYHWGWDWGPILMTCGPWKPVLLEVWKTRIEDLRVDYSLAEDFSSAVVDIEASRLCVRNRAGGRAPAQRRTTRTKRSFTTRERHQLGQV